MRANRVIFEYLLAYKAMERAEFNTAWAEASRLASRMDDELKPAKAMRRFYWDTSTEPKPRVGQAHGYYWMSTYRSVLPASLQRSTV